MNAFSGAKKLVKNSWGWVLKNPATFRVYNSVFELNKTPLSLINFLVRINRFVPLEALDGKSYSIRLRGTNTIIHLPPLRSLQQWQFSQSYRWHDPFFTELIRTALKNFSAKIFFDIGANQGLRSLDPLSQGCNVIAFEPNEIAIDFLRQIIALNPVLKQQECRIIVAAVGDQAGQVEFEIDSSSYLSSVKSTPKHSEFLLERTIRANCIRMDDFINKNSLDATGSIVKVDVEGFEVEVLRGWGELLRLPQVIFVEATMRTLDTTHKLLSRVGFKLFYINSSLQKIIPLDIALSDSGVPKSGTFDIMATKTIAEWLPLAQQVGKR